MTRPNPFKRHSFPHEVTLLAKHWHSLYPLSCRDVRDMFGEWSEKVEASTIRRWVCGFGPETASGPSFLAWL